MVVTMSQNSWDVLENLLITDIFLLVFDNHGQKQLSAQWDEIASPLKVLKLVFTEVSDGRSCSKNWFAAVLLDSPQLAFKKFFFWSGLAWKVLMGEWTVCFCWFKLWMPSAPDLVSNYSWMKQTLSFGFKLILFCLETLKPFSVLFLLSHLWVLQSRLKIF